MGIILGCCCCSLIWLFITLSRVIQFNYQITHARFAWHREAVKNVFNPFFDKGKLWLDQPKAWQWVVTEFKFIHLSICSKACVSSVFSSSGFYFLGILFLHVYQLAIWFQNSSLYHFSMFHASHHIVPVPATKEEVYFNCGCLLFTLTFFWPNSWKSFSHQIEAEASSVEAVARTFCPLTIILDRVVLTSTGVLLGCWQVVFHNLKDF